MCLSVFHKGQSNISLLANEFLSFVSINCKRPYDVFVIFNVIMLQQRIVWSLIFKNWLRPWKQGSLEAFFERPYFWPELPFETESLLFFRELSTWKIVIMNWFNNYVEIITWCWIWFLKVSLCRNKVTDYLVNMRGVQHQLLDIF